MYFKTNNRFITKITNQPVRWERSRVVYLGERPLAKSCRNNQWKAAHVYRKYMYSRKNSNHRSELPEMNLHSPCLNIVAHCFLNSVLRKE